MKINIKKSLSKISIKKVLLIAIVFAVAIALPSQLNQKVSADQYDDKINSLQKDIEKYKAESDRLNAQAITLESALAALANQKAAIQAQIDISQAKYDKLLIEIAETEKKIKDNQDALGITIASLYVDDDITPIEMLASSKTIGEYLDKQEYRNSIRDELTSTIAKVKELKEALTKQKIDVKKLLDSQKDQRASLVAKEQEQANLLSATKGQESEYQKLISSSQAQIAEARATQALLNARIQGSGGFTLIDGGSLVDYPWNASNCPMWGYLSTGGSNGNGGDGYGYGCRQCASYVAWRFAKETGLYPSWGNAVDFTANAIAAGYVEGVPQAGSIAVMDPAKAGQSYGHVAWVESDPYTNSLGHTVIQVSQYNYDYGQGYGMYSLMELSVNAFDHYIHIK